MSADEGLVMPHRAAVVMLAVRRDLLELPYGRDVVMAAVQGKAEAFLAENGYRLADGADITVAVYDDNPLDDPRHPARHPDVPLGCVLVRADFDTVQLPTIP